MSNDQENTDNINDPLVDDNEFRELMNQADKTDFSAADIAMLKRIEEKLLNEVNDGNSQFKTQAKFGWSWDDVKDVSFKRFLAVAAVVSLCVGVSISLLMSPEEKYEGEKGDDAVAIAVTLTLRTSGSDEAILRDETPPGTILIPEVFTDKDAYVSLVVFRNGARTITTPAEKLLAGSETGIKQEQEQAVSIEMENQFDNYSICILAADSQTRLSSLLNAYATEAATLSAGTCRKIRVASP